MFILYVILFIITLVISIFVGMKMSENINHTTLLVFFWIIYIATLLTIGNAVSTVFFYNVLRIKRGIPGDQGRIGDKGDVGIPGLCDVTCSSKVCNLTIINGINDYYTSLKSQYVQSTTPKFKETIKNREVMDNIKIICNSDAYKQVSKFKPPKIINDYIIDIYTKWLKVLFDADKTEDKHIIIEYLETDGLEERPELDGNPFNEIEKYDIYYWGRDRVFHPRVIEYCNIPDINKKMPQMDPPLLKGIKTNMYSPVLDHYRFEARMGAIKKKSKYVSIYRVNPYSHLGVVYYPLGDFITGESRFNDTNKFVEHYGIEKKNRIDFKDNNLMRGPSIPTVLVAGTDKYLRPPQDWELIWTNTNGKYGNNNVSIWRPKDYYDKTLNKWFRGCGVFSLVFAGKFRSGQQFINPRQFYGYNTPEKQPIRLIAEELLNKINNADIEPVWNDKNSRSNYNVSVWISKDKKYRNEYNNANAISGYAKPAKDKLKFYTIKEEVFKEIPMGSVDFKHPLVDKSELGTGYLGSPEREDKYSIFSFLDIPLEIKLSNFDIANKIFIKHSGLNKINSYMIRKLESGNDELTGSFGVSTDSDNFNVSTTLKYSAGDPNQIWQIECIDENNKKTDDCSKAKRYMIKSSERNLYLVTEIDKSTTGRFSFSIRQLPDTTDKNYSTLIKKYVWFKPLSATGNQLRTKEKTNPTPTPKTS
jgi:hypothetical protein